MKYVHSKERKHPCTRCDSKFKHKKDLKNHFLYVHNNNLYEEMYLQPKDVKKFDCEQCNSSYQQKKDLNAHIRYKHTGDHLGDQPILHCDLCPLVFKVKKSLVAHKKKKHENSNIEYCCSVCGKKFCCLMAISENHVKSAYFGHLLISVYDHYGNKHN